MAKNLITRHELKNIVSLSVNKKTLEDAKSQLAGLLNNLDVDFSSEDFKQGFKDIVAMFNAAFEQAGKDIDLSSMMPSRENFVKLGQEYRAAFEEALSELSLKGGFRFDFASEDLKQAVVYLEKIAENTTKKATKNLNKSADEIKAAVYRLNKEEEKLKNIQETLDYQPTQDKDKKEKTFKNNKILLGKLAEQYDTSDNWEDKYHAALRYLKIYEKLQKVNEYDFSDPDDKALTAKYQLFSKQKDHIVTTLTNLLATHASSVISGSESGQAVKVEVKTDGLATEETLGKILTELQGKSGENGKSTSPSSINGVDSVKQYISSILNGFDVELSLISAERDNEYKKAAGSKSRSQSEIAQAAKLKTDEAIQKIIKELKFKPSIDKKELANQLLQYGEENISRDQLINYITDKIQIPNVNHQLQKVIGELEDLSDDISYVGEGFEGLNEALDKLVNRLSGVADDTGSGISDGKTTSANNKIRYLIEDLLINSDKERGTFLNLTTGQFEDITTGNAHDISTVTFGDYKKAKNKYDARIHSHTGDVAAPSVLGDTNDFKTWATVFDYIKKQIIATRSELLAFDFSSLTKDQLEEIRVAYQEEATKIDKETDNTEELNIRMRQALEKIIAPYGSNIMKSYKVPNVISNSFAENDNSVSVLNEISRKAGDKIAQEQTLKEIRDKLVNANVTITEQPVVTQEKTNETDPYEAQRTTILKELSKYGTLKEAMAAGSRKIAYDGNEVHFGSFVSDYFDKALGQGFDRKLYEDLWKEARKTYYKYTPKELNKGDAIDVLRDKVPSNILDGWFRSADSSYKAKLEEVAMSDEEIRNAALSIMWDNYKAVSGKDIGFDEFLNSNIPVYRGKNSENYVNGDELLSFTFDRKVAEKFGQHVLETFVKPIDTLGSYQTTGEAEVLVYRNQLEDKSEYKKWHDAMAGIVRQEPVVDSTPVQKKDDDTNVLSENLTKLSTSVSTANDKFTTLNGTLENVDKKVQNINANIDDKKEDATSKADSVQNENQSVDNSKEIKDAKSAINNAKNWLKYLDGVLDENKFDTSGKKEATEQLKHVCNVLLEWIRDPNGHLDSGSGYGEEKRIVALGRARDEALKQGVAQSTLDRYNVSTLTSYQDALATLQKEREFWSKLLAEEEAKLAELQSQKTQKNENVDNTNKDKSIEDGNKSLIENTTNLSTSVSTANDKFTELNKTLEGFDGVVKTINEKLAKEDTPDVEPTEDVPQENQDPDANKKPTQTVAIDEEGLQRVFDNTTFKVQIAKSEETEDEDKEDPKLKQIEEKINAVQTTVNKIDTNVNKKTKEPSTLSKILEHVKSIDGKLVDGAQEKSKKQEEKERKQQGLDELAQKAKLLGQLEAKDKIFGSVEALEQAIALEEELKTGFKDLGFNENSAEWDKLTKVRSDAYKKEVDTAKIKDSDKIRLRVLHDLKDSYKEFGEILAKVEIAKEENDGQEIARLEKERANIKKKIDEQRKHIKLTSSEDKDLTTIQTEQKNKVKNQYDEKKQQAYNVKIKDLLNMHEKLGQLQAKSEATNDPKAKVEIEYLEKEIDLELQKLGIIKDISNEQYQSLNIARENAKEKQGKIEAEKQQKKDLKAQIKEEKKRVRISDADSADRSANKTLLSLWKIDDESVDTTKLAEVTKLTSSLKELKNTRDMVNKTIASGKDVKDEDIAKLRENTQEVIKHQTAVKELIENYERFSDGNSKSLNATLNPNSDVKSQLEAQVKAFHGANVKIKEYDEKTKTLTYTVKTGANEFTTYTAGVRQVDNALRTVQGTTTRTETLFESIARKTKEIFTYFSGSSVIYKAFNEFQKGIQYVREIDSALTELKKVTDETEESYDRFLKTASKTADKVGSTIAKVVNSTADWARLNI